MKIKVNSFRASKVGYTKKQCEDSLYPYIKGEVTKDIFSFAIADGTTVSMLSRLWAKILVKLYCQNKISNIETTAEQIVDQAQKCWPKWRSRYIKKREKQNKPIKWYEEHGLEKGAFSTLLGITLLENNEWKVDVVGDSCLFQIRNNSLITQFPISSPNGFSSHPPLICSHPISKKCDFEQKKGDWQTGDIFYLMTDAMAHWFLYTEQEKQLPWKTIKEMFEQAQVSATEGKTFIETWLNNQVRNQPFVQDDDMSLLQLEII